MFKKTSHNRLKIAKILQKCCSERQKPDAFQRFCPTLQKQFLKGDLFDSFNGWRYAPSGYWWAGRENTVLTEPVWLSCYSFSLSIIPWSGKERTLPTSPPLRTGRESFPSSGSSLPNAHLRTQFHTEKLVTGSFPLARREISRPLWVIWVCETFDFDVTLNGCSGRREEVDSFGRSIFAKDSARE